MNEVALCSERGRNSQNLLALLEQDGGVVPTVLQRLNVSVNSLKQHTQTEIGRLARVNGEPRPVSSSASDGKLVSWIASSSRRTPSRASPAWRWITSPPW